MLRYDRDCYVHADHELDSSLSNMFSLCPYSIFTGHYNNMLSDRLNEMFLQTIYKESNNLMILLSVVLILLFVCDSLIYVYHYHGLI